MSFQSHDKVLDEDKWMVSDMASGPDLPPPEAKVIFLLRVPECACYTSEC